MLEWTKLEAMIVNRRQELTEIAARSRLLRQSPGGEVIGKGHHYDVVADVFHRSMTLLRLHLSV